MLLIMVNKIQIIYIHKYSFLRTFVPCKIAIPISYRQVLYSLQCIESPWLVGALGDRERLAGLGLMDGFLGTGGLHLGSLKKKKPHSLICFQYKWKIQTDGFAFGLGFLLFFFLLFLSLSCEIYFISFEMFQGKHLCFESLNSSLS